jgi:hypothetical protein
VSPGLQGPVKMVEMMVNMPSDGISSVEKSDDHAAFHAARNARVSSSRDPLPDAPNARAHVEHLAAGAVLLGNRS